MTSDRIDLKKVAGAALDSIKGEEMLADHDRRYHGGHYRGGKCLYREKYYNVDNCEPAPAEVDEVEGRIYSGRRYEQELIERDFANEFGIDQKKGMRQQFLEPDKDGVNQLEITCRGDMPDDFIDRDKVGAFFKKRGYEFRGIGIENVEGKGPRGKAKKVFRIDAYRPEKFELAKGGHHEVGEVIGVGEEGDMSEEKKNAALKRFGMKSEGGKMRKRTGDDNRVDRARKYLGIVGDWEGQSTKSDKESDSWEKRRLAMLKRAQDDKAKEAASEGM